MPPNETTLESTPAACTAVTGWTLHECATVASTNDAAAALPAWHAVRADSQTAGRGRWRRPWISDRGGLWLSAVLPTPGDATRWRALPLAVGLAVAETVAALGVTEVRLRWPNDVLVRDRKLAGLLLDCFQPGLAVAGIGINVTNTPEFADDSLRGTTVRLADMVAPVPDLTALTGRLLAALRHVHAAMDKDGFAVLLPAVNALWGGPRRVELDLGGARATGWFQGVDAAGRLALEREDQVVWFDPVQVVQLREIEAA